MIRSSGIGSSDAVADGGACLGLVIGRNLRGAGAGRTTGVVSAGESGTGGSWTPTHPPPGERPFVRRAGSSGVLRGLLANVRDGRLQRLLAAATALSAPPLALEVYLEHYKGSFGDRWMWTPIVLAPPLTAAGVAGLVSERAARTVLPAVGALYALDGLIGIVTHVQGVRRRPGGFGEPTYNLVIGPPLLAPGSLCMVGGMAILAALVKRER
jgi:hypothetical protein